jgi:glycosyltransferase involved in cell wall biosynthesis
MNELKRKRKSLLIASPTFPYPLVAGGKIRIYNIIKELSKYFDITLVSLIEANENTEGNMASLEKYCKIKTVQIRQDRIAQALRLTRYLFHWLGGTPAEILVKRSYRLRKTVSRILKHSTFDYVQIEYIQGDQYLCDNLNIAAPTFLIAHDISYISQERKVHVASGAAKWFWSREARLMKKYEIKTWKKYDCIFTMSNKDKMDLNEHLPKQQVKTIPNGVDTGSIRPISESDVPTIVFVGWMRHFPNRDAISWFLKEIWPLVKLNHDHVRFRVVGKGLASNLVDIIQSDKRVEYLDYVTDICECVGESWISVVPIRIGSGSRLKILESMALGTPVVTTTVGCEGIDAVDNVHALFSDTPDTICEKIIYLLENQELRLSLSRQARLLVEKSYSWQSSGERAKSAIESFRV